MCNALAMTPFLKLLLLYFIICKRDQMWFTAYVRLTAHGSRLTVYSLLPTACGLWLTAYVLRLTDYILRLTVLYRLSLTAYCFT